MGLTNVIPLSDQISPPCCADKFAKRDIFIVFVKKQQRITVIGVWIALHILLIFLNHDDDNNSCFPLKFNCKLRSS